MPFEIPTLEQSLQRTRERMRAELPGTDANVWPNTNAVYAKVIAGQAWEMYNYLSWIARQSRVTTADGDMLDAHGAQYSIARRAPAPARGFIKVTGEAGYLIPEGTLFARSDGTQFRVLISGEIASDETVELRAEAVIPGPDGNTIGATELVPVSFAEEIESVAVDDIGLGGGANVEDDESYRARILLRMRYPPHGGAAHDYVFWALEIAGVTRVWVDPLAFGPGTVGVWFMSDDSGADGIPGAVLVGNVATYIESNRPVTARVTVAAPKAAKIDVCISGIGDPLQSVKEAILGELKDVFRRNVQVSLPNAPFTLRNNVLWQAVSRATRDSTHRVSIPAADVTFGPGVIPVLGTICYLEG